MERKGFTTIEQSKKLLETGISPESANMNIPFSKRETSYIKGIPTMRPYIEVYNELLCVLGKDEADKRVLPCWSLSALIGLMPDKIEEYVFLCVKSKGEMAFAYADKKNKCLYTTYGNPIDAAVEMVCWLKEQNYI